MRDDTSAVQQRSNHFIRFLNCFFKWVGCGVADYPYTTILVVTVLTVFSSLKIPFVRSKDDLKVGYTPPEARAFNELEVFREFNDGKDPVVAVIFVLAKDGGSMARITHLNETVDIVDYVGNHFPVKNYTYYRMCKNFCDANEPVRQFRNGFLLHGANSVGGNNNSSGVELIDLSFPIMKFLGRDLDLSPYFFGVDEFSPDDANKISTTNIRYMKLVALHFRTQRPSEWSNDDTFRWERLVGNYFRNKYNSSLIRPIVFSLAFTQDEIVRTGFALMPYISIGFMIMCAFAVGTVTIGSAYMRQLTIHKVSFALIGCITPLMATSSALGILFFLGLRAGSILCVTPFLVLAIGVDDAFLMINAWNRTGVEMNKSAKYGTVRERMVAVLIDIGPSITITSLTNMLAFGIGIFTTPIPEIQLLCIANATAIFLDYTFTITLYAAVMCVGGRWEMGSKVDQSDPVTVQQKHEEPSTAAIFLRNYCKWLSSGFTTTMVFILLVAYWRESIKGVLMAKGRLTPEKLFLADSPMIEVSKIHSEVIMPSYTFVTVFVTKPGDLRNSTRLNRVKDMVAQYEAVQGCKGSRFTRFWLRDYEAYLETKNEESDEDAYDAYTSDDLMKFIEWPEYESWGGFMKFDNQTNRLTAFYVTIAYVGENQSDWTQRLHMLKAWRVIADRYKDIGASVYEEEALFTDQIETLVPTTLQTSLVILICMAVVCSIFMCSVFTVLVAVSSIISICIGVFGFLTLWDVDVDPVSMATLIMSIGLSVDFPAHITFHYYRTGFDPSLASTQQRLAHSFAAIGFPLLQCSFSTVLFVLVLLLVPCYMSEVFTKAIVLVISLGTAHALVAVPALLCALSNIYQYFSFMRDNKSTSSAGTTTTKLADSEVADAAQEHISTHKINLSIGPSAR